MMSGHVHKADSAVLERRLRPIYDWLDSGNNKKALQECEKVLKKTPNLHCGKALKALTLLRMGREFESNQLLEHLTGENPYDEATLQAMTLCYREMQQVEKICKLYDTAVKMDPLNEELHTHLFMSYVRVGDFKMQQQSAMALYRQKPKNPYYCWNVMSIILQATRGEGAKDEKKRILLLSLAERMMQKLADDNKIDAEQEVQLWIMILDLQGKYDRILEILDGTLGEKLQCSNIPTMKLTYLKRLNHWSKVNSICKNILSENFDKWDIWKDYINSAFQVPQNEVISVEDHLKIEENGEKGYLECPDNSPEKCHEFICGIIEGGATNTFLLRGPYLARFELCSKIKEKGLNSEEVLGNTTELFIEYFRNFGHKPCCVGDLRIYMHLLNEQQKSDLASRLIKEVGVSPDTMPQSVDHMQRHIGALQLARLSGAHKYLTANELKQLGNTLALYYHHGYKNFGQGLPSTDLGPADNYIVLAAHILYNLSVTENNCSHLIEGIRLLEILRKNSPCNFHAKLLLLKFYHILGSPMNADVIYQTLEIKHLQLDSLGYLHCGLLATSGLFSSCIKKFDSTLKFFSLNYKDSTDHLTFSYKFGSFIKLEEFMDFRERLDHSLHYTSVVIDRIIISLLDCSSVENLYHLDISPKDNKIEWDQLRDNRDLQVVVNWEPEFAKDSVEHSEDIKRLFQQDLKFLKLRTHILWSLSAAIEVLKSVDGIKEKNIENLKQVIKDWLYLEEGLSKNELTSIKQDLIPYPMPSRLHGFLETPYRLVITSLLEFFILLASDSPLNDIQTGSSKVEKEIENLENVLKEKIINKSSDFREKRKGMELAVNVVEVIGVCCMLCHMCNELVRPQQPKKGKKKQPNANINTLKSKEFLTTIVNRLKNQINACSVVIETFSQVDLNDSEKLTLVFDCLTVDMDSDGVFKNINTSYELANREIQDIFKGKLKLLSSL